VQPLAEALRGAGFSVWWDRNIIAGKQYDRVIEQALDEAKCVIVCWSRHSVDSEWVKNEAAAGAERGILVPVFLDEVRLPLEFRRRQTVSLIDWNGAPSEPGFVELCEGIRAAIDGHHPEKSGPAPRVVDHRPPRQRRTWTAVAALFLIMLAAGGVYLAYRARVLPDANGRFLEYPLTAQIFSGSTVISRGVFTPRGYVLAMAHGVPDPAKVSVGWVDGDEVKHSSAEVVKHGLVTKEVLLLRLKDPPDRRMPFPTRIAATLQPNESVERYLTPNDRAPGKVKKLFAEMDVHTGKQAVRLNRLLLTTMIAGPGDSGAPVVDANGQVVGLVYGASQSETISLMIEDVKISFPEAF
jgi:hypothetical protein